MYVRFENDTWENSSPTISVVTPIYNRCSTIKRTIESLKNQTFKDFEYILVDDGSTDDLDSILLPIIEKLQFPVLYLKKENGGVHTARNIAISRARGKYTVFLDSDDELKKNAFGKFLEAWSEIPKSSDMPYREVVAQCEDQNGLRVGDTFPENINDLPWKDAIVACDKTRGEHVAMLLTQTLKDNPWPEPDGIKLVTEDIVWKKLEKEYRSYYINDTLRIYHTNTEGSYSNSKKSLQYCRNVQWNTGYYLDRWDIYKSSKNNIFKQVLLYEVFTDILIKNSIEPYRLTVKKYPMIRAMMKLPSMILTLYYVKNRLNVSLA